MRLEIVPLADVPERDILALMKLALGDESTRSSAYWHWKHHDNPFGRSPGLVAIGPEGPAAVRVFLNWELGTVNARYRAVRAVDTATHPDWRRQGLFRRLTEALVEQVQADGVALVFNTPNEASRPGYLSMGWRPAGPLPVVLKPRRPFRQLRARLSGRPSALSLPTGLDAPDEVLARALVSDVLEAQVATGRLGTPRSIDYLRWRYAEVPVIDYGALARAAEGHAALGIFRLRQRAGARELIVCELLSTPGARGSALAADLCRLAARRSDADYVAAIGAPGMSSWRSLRGGGFLPLRLKGPILTVRELGGVDWSDLTPARDWDVTAGDLELF